MAIAVARAGRATDRSPATGLERPAIGVDQSDRDDVRCMRGAGADHDQGSIADDGRTARSCVASGEDAAAGVRRVLRIARQPATAAPRRVRTETSRLAMVK